MTEIVVYDAAKAIATPAGQPVESVVIFRSPTIGPFYLSWTPDGRDVSFLAEDATGLALRLAPADGSAPLDGSGPGSTVRSGNPFYFDWIDADRLFAHVGTGPDAILEELGRNGASAASPLKAPGDFRSPMVSHDGSFIGYVRTRSGGTSEVVVSARDGSNARTMPVFGPSAVTFDPLGNRIASIGATETPQTAYSVPLGPLRLLDAKSGAVRTLVDGNVVAFWWAPDGTTIAALRVGTGDATSPPASGGPAPSEPPSVPPSSASPEPSAQPPVEVRLVFVDVASGKVRAQPVVSPGQLFIDQLLVYFDQYALSHHLWAPDSSSFLMPIVDPDGSTHLAVLSPNDDPPVMIDGAIGFWSP